MAELRDAMVSLGFHDVSTYIQSGNLLFTTTGRSRPASLAARIAAAVEERFGFATGVVVLTRGELAEALDRNPYAGEPNAKALHLVFLDRGLGRPTRERIDEAQAKVAAKRSRDSFRIVGRILYLHTPDGYGRSELAQLVNRALAAPANEVVATARNLATSRKLLELLDA
jgi:uncharacterized protein (DUF1697 family)